MEIAIVGAGIAGLSAAWWLRRAGHRVIVFEQNYKPGGRLNSRRKAGLVVDHGERYLQRDEPVLREIILDCGLHSELATIDAPVYHMNPDGSFVENPQEAVSRNRVTFADGLLTLPEALKRSCGGFYSIAVRNVSYNEKSRRYMVETEPPIRARETEADAVIIATEAPAARQIAQPIAERLHPGFLEWVESVCYTRCLTLVAALPEVELPEPFYGIYPPKEPNALLGWLAFEDRKCRGRAVAGWSSLVAHMTPEASAKYWAEPEENTVRIICDEARRLVPQIPEEWRWARCKPWYIARLANDTEVRPIDDHPAAPDDVLVEFCGDYRAGDGVESAARSGRDAANALLRKMETGT